MNSLHIIGNLTREPEARTIETSNGERMVGNFTVAVNKRVRNEKTADFFRVTCWGKDAENAVKYLHKGSKVAVQGEVTARAFVGQDNQVRASLEVNARQIEYLSARSTEQEEQDDQHHEFTEVEDDELPF